MPHLLLRHDPRRVYPSRTRPNRARRAWILDGCCREGLVVWGLQPERQKPSSRGTCRARGPSSACTASAAPPIATRRTPCTRSHRSAPTSPATSTGTAPRRPGTAPATAHASAPKAPSSKAPPSATSRPSTSSDCRRNDPSPAATKRWRLRRSERMHASDLLTPHALAKSSADQDLLRTADVGQRAVDADVVVGDAEAAHVVGRHRARAAPQGDRSDRLEVERHPEDASVGEV